MISCKVKHQQILLSLLPSHNYPHSSIKPYSSIDPHSKPTFHPLGDFLNPALALLGQGLKKLPIGKKLDFANQI
jgi:hypothetical protein